MDISRGFILTLAIYLLHELSAPLEKKVVEKEPGADIVLFMFYFAGMTAVDYLINK